MISNTNVLNREIRESIKRIEKICERLELAKPDQVFVEILAEFGAEIANNPLFKSYIKSIANKENKYRQKPDIISILQKATYTPVGQQALDQNMLTRTERKSEYFSLRIVLRYNELYDISLHGQVRTELIAKNDLRDLAHFDAEAIVISNILEGNSNANLADYYLPHAHRVLSGIIQFFDKEQSISDQALNGDSKNKSKKQNKTFKQRIIIKKILDEQKVLLSTDGKNDIRLELYQKNILSEQTNQIKVYLEIIKGPIIKHTLKKVLKLSNKQIERAYRSINTKVRDNWNFSEYLIYDKKSSKYYINSSYPTTLENL